MNTISKTFVAAACALVLGLAGGYALSRWQAGAVHEAAVATPAPAASAGRTVLYWYDPMVPTQKFDKPGKSPFMDMQLVPRYADESAVETAGTLGVSPQAQQSLGVRTVAADKRRLATRIDAAGTIGLDDRDVSIVQARANGFVERVVPRAPGDLIAKGAVLAEVLHPDWLAAQREYLAVRATGDTVLAQASRARLALLGMPAGLVERIEASGQAQAITTIVAPSGGLIAELMVRPGMTVSPGMTLARINGLAKVWVEAALPEALAATVRPGQLAEVRLPAWPGEVLQGTVGSILPEANRETRTLRLHIVLPNPGQKLRAGMFAQVVLQGGAAGEVVTVPADAVIRTGRRAIVYRVDAPGRFRPVEVELGAEVDERIEIRRGLEAGQQVVASGQFMVDSEASLQGVMARAPAAPGFAATGRVISVDGDLIRLDHGPVPELKWPAMKMPFVLADPAIAKGLKPGDEVRFRFRQDGGDNVVTAIDRAASAAGAKP